MVLGAARLFGGLAAGMAFPTTLALITALWSGPGRTRSIALWSGVGGAMAALGPLAAGAMLEKFWWGSVFLITLPLAVVAVIGALWLVPSGVNETTAPVDNLGGVLSVVMVGSVVLGINIAPEPGMGTDALVMIGRRPAWRSRSSWSASAGPATRSTTSTSPAAAPSGWPAWPASSCSAH